jgi:D-3-phosphoglycerate dehydrogenase
VNILHLDENHPVLIEGLSELGFQNEIDYSSSKPEIESIIEKYDGIVIRSRFPIDKQFLDAAKNLKFIARVGAGLENIDLAYAEKKAVKLFSAPEGNRNAVGEHSLGLILNLFNKINTANAEVKNGEWKREANRGIELDGKTVGIIGYGNMGKAFAKKLRGFEAEVIFYDLKPDIENGDAKQVSLEELQQKADVLSLHVPITETTNKMVDNAFIQKFSKAFWLINTARGECVVTKDLVKALKSKKIRGAGLDVLEYEKSSFENLFRDKSEMPADFRYLIQAENVILSPHVAGWTVESKEKLARVVVRKIKTEFA